MKEETINKLAEEAQTLGYGSVSRYIWEACCMKLGVGGTAEAKGAYERIMRVLLKELHN